MSVLKLQRFEYKWQAALIVGLGLFLSVLDSTIVSVALPAVRSDLHTDFNTVTWVASSYFLAQAAVIPVSGYLSGRYGTKLVFMVAMGVFTLGSMLCVLAPTETMLIAARVVQGIGGGGIFPTSFAIAYRAFPRDEWGRATTIIGVPVLLAPALGPVIGGYLTTSVGWRSIFALNLPLGALSFALAGLLLHGRARDVGEAAEGGPPERLDLRGLILAAAAFSALVFGLTQAGTRGWSDRSVFVSIGAGLALLAVLVVAELRIPEPVLDFRLFRNATFVRSVSVLWIVSAFYYGGLFLIPFFLERVRNLSPLAAGQIMIIQGVGAAIGIGIGGEAYNKLGPRRLISAGTALLAISSLGFTHLSVDTTGISLQAWLFLRGFGLGLTNTPVQNLALSVVHRRNLDRGSSLVNVTRQVFIAGGVAALASLTTQRATGHAKALASSLASHPLRSSVASCLHGPSTGTAGCVSRHAIVLGLNDVFMVSLVGCVLAVLIAQFIGRDPSLEALRGPAVGAIAAAFPQLSRVQLLEAGSRARPVTLEVGDTVIHQGDSPDLFYVIESGAVAVTRRGPEGAETQLARLAGGSYFGEIGLLDNVPRTATVVSLEHTSLQAIDRDTFLELLSDHATARRVRDEAHARMAAWPV